MRVTMRWMPVCALILGCQTPPARDPADVERIRVLEARVTSLEAMLAKPPAPAEPAKKAPPPEPAADPAKLVTKPYAPPRAAPNPATTYNVPVDDSPTLGPAVAPVTLVASLQFPEPFTHKAFPTLGALRKQYGKDLRIVIKQFVVHPTAASSSIAACAAAYQNALEPMEAAIWDAATDPTLAPASGGRRLLEDAELREIARALRLDLKEYDRDLVTCTAAQARDRGVLDKLGQRGVPAFWINGRYLSGAQPIESFRVLVEEEREKWKADKAAGGKPATYYDRITAGAPTSL